jgi:hypothetical protein
VKRIIVVTENGETWEEFTYCKLYVVNGAEWKELTVDYLYPKWVLRHRAGISLKILYTLFRFISEQQPKLWTFFKEAYKRGEFNIKLE